MEGCVLSKRLSPLILVKCKHEYKTTRHWSVIKDYQLGHVLNRASLSLLPLRRWSGREVASSVGEHVYNWTEKQKPKSAAVSFSYTSAPHFSAFKQKWDFFFCSAIWVKGRLHPSTVSTLVPGYIYLERLASYTAAHSLFCSPHWAHREDLLQNCVSIGRVIPIQ